MAAPVTLSPQVIRVPNLPDGKIVDEEGNGTEDELNFRHTLITNLQKLFGGEGLVMPTQNQQVAPNDYVTQIQNNQNSQGQYTCQLGTMLYVIHDPSNYLLDKVMIAVRADNDYPNTAPVFKTVTLT